MIKLKNYYEPVRQYNIYQKIVVQDDINKSKVIIVENMKIKIKKFNDVATLPKKATKYSTGFDVTVTEIIHHSKDRVECKLGFGLQFDKQVQVSVRPRSSFTKYKWIMNNSPGTGDPDYPGEYCMIFNAIPTGTCQDYETKEVFLCYDDFPYKVGDRIGQLVITEGIKDLEFEETDEFDETDSDRTGGWGSTGIN